MKYFQAKENVKYDEDNIPHCKQCDKPLLEIDENTGDQEHPHIETVGYEHCCGEQRVEPEIPKVNNSS